MFISESVQIVVIILVPMIIFGNRRLKDLSTSDIDSAEIKYNTLQLFVGPKGYLIPVTISDEKLIRVKRDQVDRSRTGFSVSTIGYNELTRRADAVLVLTNLEDSVSFCS